MRFFSNEAKESADNENDQERAESDGVAVPQQRSGSPWSDAPGNAEASTSTEVADEPTRDDSEEASRVDENSLPGDEESLPGLEESRADGEESPAGSPGSAESPADREEPLQRDDSEERHDGDDLVLDADAPRHDDDLLDLPLDDRAGSHRADSDSNGAAPVDEEPGAEQRGGTTTTYGPDGTLTTVDATGDSETQVTDGSENAEADGAVLDTTGSESGVAEEESDRDLDEASPVVATVPASDEAEAEAAPAEPVGAVEPVAPAVPVGAVETATAAKPDPSASPVGDKLFTEDDSFNERLRDITLSFVDDPKEATAQAGALVDEAIDKVTSALKAQKDTLAGEGDDTERLRVELRGYRDILKRISSL